MIRQRELAITALELRFRAASSIAIPEYAGALFRGGFGKYLRELVCRTGAPVCDGCAYLTSCAYGIVFETPATVEQSVMLKAYPYAPHLFVLTPPLEGRRVAAGEEFAMQLTLIGRGRGYLAHFIEGLDAMGRAGRYGGSFRMVDVRDAEGDRGRIYDGAPRRLVRPLPAWYGDHARAARRLRMVFETPLRLREKGEYTMRPGFAALVQALVRLIHMLGCAHGGWRDEL